MLDGKTGARYARLRALMAELGGVVVGLSGGVDSSLLARVAHDTLDRRAVAVIARSPSLPQRELDAALAVARRIGLRHRVVDTAELDDPRYAANRPNRCYFCKLELFTHLRRVASEEGLAWIAYGENRDDDGDHRPGRAAAARHGVRAPLREAGLTKADVRAIARMLDLPVWDKPAFACLASRFPYGSEITADKLAQVERAEDNLWHLGFRQVRVRHHGDLARIEVDRADLPRAVVLAEEIVALVGDAGFAHVTLDLAGYRRGSLNPRATRELPLLGDTLESERG
ncbi:MAG TPA: ATP-dependent sacrificial sulfur transferase LarE [Nitriliruptorales bacterium]|nr:ATP-dependent sacrificial sulfur transferase LarE [Nitriliruptorales bacterium]